MTPGLAVASGNWGVDLPSNAYDADSVTAWVANCPESCNETRQRLTDGLSPNGYKLTVKVVFFFGGEMCIHGQFYGES